MQWDYPQNDGGTLVDNYTLSLIDSKDAHLSTNTSVQAMTTFTLDYNEEYTVKIAATNCAGTGGAVSLNISEGTDTSYVCTKPIALLQLTSYISFVLGSKCTTTFPSNSSRISHYTA